MLQSTTKVRASLPTRLHEKNANSQTDDSQVFSFTETNKDLAKALVKSRKIQLPYSLVSNGRAVPPPNGDYSDLLKLFPGTISVEIASPFLVIRLSTLPPSPWPLALGGLPVHFTTDQTSDGFQRGRLGQGTPELKDINMQKDQDFNKHVLSRAIGVFQERQVAMRDIYWYGGFWRLTIPNDTDFKILPARIAGQPAFYQKISEVQKPNLAALRKKTPTGVEYDNAIYKTSSDALLRPGIMLGGSLLTSIVDGKPEDSYKSTTSGILVANEDGYLFITVSTYGFEQDGLVWHADPKRGTVIANIVKDLPGLDISIAKLKPGLRYVNETFGSMSEPQGSRITGLCQPYPPHLKIFDPLTMNNPFSGFCDGLVMALGATVEQDSGKYIKHVWHYFESGQEPIQGSCGTPILNDDKNVVGMFRYKLENSSMCLTVSAIELREFGYQICGGIQQFNGKN